MLAATEVVTDIGNIDTHLAEVFRRSAGIEGEGKALSVVRSLLLNLVVYAEGAEETRQAIDVLSELMGSHPCRAIVIDASRPKPGTAPAIVSAVCGITERGERRLCGEIIELRTGETGADMAGTVMPLLTPDVPVFLWMWREAACGVDELRDIAEPAEHLIVDSRRFADLRTWFSETLPACLAGNNGKTVQDLSWTYLLPWRELTARHFDPPQARSYLAHLSNVVVKYSPGEREGFPPSAPLLFVSWLMERTGLRPAEVSRADGGYRVMAMGNDTRVRIDIIPEELGYAPGGLNSVLIQGADENGTATFITRGVSGTHVSVAGECAGICYPAAVLELPPLTEAALVSRALDQLRRDRVYEAASAVAVEILARLA